MSPITPRKNWNALFGRGAATVGAAAAGYVGNRLFNSGVNYAASRILGRPMGPQFLKIRKGGNNSLRGRKGASSSKSKGFFRKGSSKYAKNKWSKIATTDVVKTTEYGTVDSQKYCSYLGHMTCPSFQMMDVFAKSLLKLMAQRMGIDIADFLDVVPAGILAGDIFQLRWNNISGASFSINYVVPAGTVTFEGLAGGIRNMFQNNWSDTVLPDVLFYIPVARDALSVTAFSRVFLNLRGMRVRVTCKSTMKLQNRSKNNILSGEDQADEVDNVPVYGKSYEGRGSGTQMISSEGTELFGDKSKSLIYFNTGNTGSLREPPQASAFVNVQRSGKLHLDPSEIKTSVLTHSGSMPLNKFLSAFIVTDDTHSVGKFRFFAIEKMIETANVVGDIIPMTIGFEINNKIGIKIITKKTNNTVTQFEQIP